MTFNDHREFWTEFLELYRDQRALWDVKSKSYCNKNARKDGYAVLIKKCKELYPKCDERFVKSKIESFRSSFRRENRKVLNSKKTGSEQDYVYKPNLWYYNLLLFITDQGTDRKDESSIGKRKRFEAEGEEIVIDVDMEADDINCIQAHDDATAETHEDVQSTSTGISGLSHPSAASTPRSLTTSRKTRKKSSSAFEKKSERFLEKAVLANQNKFRAFGNYIAFQLEDMDWQQRVIAEKLISDVLFHGRLGCLKPSATILIEQPTLQTVIPVPQTPKTDTFPDRSIE